MNHVSLNYYHHSAVVLFKMAYEHFLKLYEA